MRPIGRLRRVRIAQERLCIDLVFQSLHHEEADAETAELQCQ